MVIVSEKPIFWQNLCEDAEIPEARFLSVGDMASAIGGRSLLTIAPVAGIDDRDVLS